MQIYDALKKDHREVSMLLDQLVNLPEGGENSKGLIDKIRDALIPHARAEEAVFYNSLRSIPGTKDLTRHVYAEHLEAERLLRVLQVKERIDLDWKKTAQELKSALSHHIDEEENKIFPAAQSLLSTEEAEKIGAAFERMKPEIRNEGLMGTTLDLIVNMMPPRFTKATREFHNEKY